MTISQRLSRANNIATDEQNLVLGKLVSVEVVNSEFPNQDTGEVQEAQQIEWIWEVATRLGKPTLVHEWTGLNVNSEKSRYYDKEWTYNELTTILIKTGLIDPETVDETDLEEIDVESLLNRDFQFELEKRSTKKNIKSVKLSTLKLV